MNIPYGATTSYGKVAEAINQPKAYRAVATAIGKNPISILIPCHRVLNSKGELAGYAGGLDRKAYLLNLEKD
jgi:methylated-DNA-[protein]-cysteine S-methyltransferase